MPRYTRASGSETGKNCGSSWECKELLIGDLRTSGLQQRPSPALTGTNICSVQICYTPQIANSSFAEWLVLHTQESTSIYKVQVKKSTCEEEARFARYFGRYSVLFEILSSKLYRLFIICHSQLLWYHLFQISNLHIEQNEWFTGQSDDLFRSMLAE